MATTVTTQIQLDRALADKNVSEIIIEPPPGVWLEISDTGSASVSAYGSASVSAYGSASVSAYDSASVCATPYVAVHLHSARATINGGVLIDLTKIEKSTWEGWAEYHGIEILDGEAILYKAVDKDLKSGRGFAYPIGETVTAPDWDARDACGNGLHLSPSPHQAQYYFEAATRFLKVAVRLDEVTVIDGNGYSTPKAKAKACRVLAEVDVHGNVVTA